MNSHDFISPPTPSQPVSPPRGEEDQADLLRGPATPYIFRGEEVENEAAAFQVELEREQPLQDQQSFQTQPHLLQGLRQPPLQQNVPLLPQMSTTPQQEPSQRHPQQWFESHPSQHAVQSAPLMSVGQQHSVTLAMRHSQAPMSTQQRPRSTCQVVTSVTLTTGRNFRYPSVSPHQPHHGNQTRSPSFYMTPEVCCAGSQRMSGSYSHNQNPMAEATPSANLSQGNRLMPNLRQPAFPMTAPQPMRPSQYYRDSLRMPDAVPSSRILDLPHNSCLKDILNLLWDGLSSIVQNSNPDHQLEMGRRKVFQQWQALVQQVHEYCQRPGLVLQLEPRCRFIRETLGEIPREGLRNDVWKDCLERWTTSVDLSRKIFHHILSLTVSSNSQERMLEIAGTSSREGGETTGAATVATCRALSGGAPGSSQPGPRSSSSSALPPSVSYPLLSSYLQSSQAPPSYVPHQSVDLSGQDCFPPVAVSATHQSPADSRPPLLDSGSQRDVAANSDSSPNQIFGPDVVQPTMQQVRSKPTSYDEARANITECLSTSQENFPFAGNGRTGNVTSPPNPLEKQPVDGDRNLPTSAPSGSRVGVPSSSEKNITANITEKAFHGPKNCAPEETSTPATKSPSPVENVCHRDVTEESVSLPSSSNVVVQLPPVTCSVLGGVQKLKFALATTIDIFPPWRSMPFPLHLAFLEQCDEGEAIFALTHFRAFPVGLQKDDEVSVQEEATAQGRLVTLVLKGRKVSAQVVDCLKDFKKLFLNEEGNQITPTFMSESEWRRLSNEFESEYTLSYLTPEAIFGTEERSKPEGKRRELLERCITGRVDKKCREFRHADTLKLLKKDFLAVVLERVALVRQSLPPISVLHSEGPKKTNLKTQLRHLQFGDNRMLSFRFTKTYFKLYFRGREPFCMNRVFVAAARRNQVNVETIIPQLLGGELPHPVSFSVLTADKQLEKWGHVLEPHVSDVVRINGGQFSMRREVISVAEAQIQVFNSSGEFALVYLKGLDRVDESNIDNFPPAKTGQKAELSGLTLDVLVLPKQYAVIDVSTVAKMLARHPWMSCFYFASNSWKIVPDEGKQFHSHSAEVPQESRAHWRIHRVLRDTLEKKRPLFTSRKVLMDATRCHKVDKRTDDEPKRPLQFNSWTATWGDSKFESFHPNVKLKNKHRKARPLAKCPSLPAAESARSIETPSPPTSSSVTPVSSPSSSTITSSSLSLSVSSAMANTAKTSSSLPSATKAGRAFVPRAPAQLAEHEILRNLRKENATSEESPRASELERSSLGKESPIVRSTKQSVHDKGVEKEHEEISTMKEKHTWENRYRDLKADRRFFSNCSKCHKKYSYFTHFTVHCLKNCYKHCLDGLVPLEKVTCTICQEQFDNAFRYCDHVDEQVLNERKCVQCNKKYCKIEELFGHNCPDPLGRDSRAAKSATADVTNVTESSNGGKKEPSKKRKMVVTETVPPEVDEKTRKVDSGSLAATDVREASCPEPPSVTDMHVEKENFPIHKEALSEKGTAPPDENATRDPNLDVDDDTASPVSEVIPEEVADADVAEANEQSLARDGRDRVSDPAWKTSSPSVTVSSVSLGFARSIRRRNGKGPQIAISAGEKEAAERALLDRYQQLGLLALSQALDEKTTTLLPTKRHTKQFDWLPPSPLDCNLCPGETFDTQSELDMHRSQHTSLMTEAQVFPPRRPWTQPLDCNLCPSREFSGEADLENHRSEHQASITETSVFPSPLWPEALKCNLCPDKEFSSEADLEQHRSTHTTLMTENNVFPVRLTTSNDQKTLVFLCEKCDNPQPLFRGVKELHAHYGEVLHAAINTGIEVSMSVVRDEVNAKLFCPTFVNLQRLRQLR